MKIQCKAAVITLILLLILYIRLKAVFGRCEDVTKDINTGDHLTWTLGTEIPCTECPRQDFSRMETVKVKQEKEADTRIIVKE